MTNRKKDVRMKKAASLRSTEKPTYQPGAIVPKSGIYLAHHAKHRIAHEVPLIEGYEFPYCSRCKEGVRFELKKASKAITEEKSPVVHVIGVFVPEVA